MKIVNQSKELPWSGVVSIEALELVSERGRGWSWRDWKMLRLSLLNGIECWGTPARARNRPFEFGSPLVLTRVTWRPTNGISAVRPGFSAPARWCCPPTWTWARWRAGWGQPSPTYRYRRRSPLPAWRVRPKQDNPPNSIPNHLSVDSKQPAISLVELLAIRLTKPLSYHSW